MADPRVLFTAGEAAALCGARIEGQPSAPILSVCSDSRSVKPGSLFVALPGERVDGHSYAGAALASGASAILARDERRSELSGLPGFGAGTAILFVPDALRALQALAREHRLRHPRIRRIGITGSAGKTTTKECAAAALGRGRAIVMNPGNFNSDVGLSLSMFALAPEHELGVFEMGMNRAGEMGELAWIYEPDIALVTNVGTAHIGILGTRDRIAEEKKQVFSRFDGRQKGLVWEDDDYAAFLRRDVRGEVLDFGPRSTKSFGGASDRGLDGYTLRYQGREFEFPLPGKHNLLNAIAAMAIAEAVGADADGVAQGLATVKPLFGRSEVMRGEMTVLRDCYNANPDSVEAAVSLCDSIEWRGRRVYVLGTMLELGAESDLAHRRIGAAAGRSRADALFFFGDETRFSFEEARASGFHGTLFHETDFDRLSAAVRAYLRSGDLVLLKASRGMALERLSDALGATAGGGSHGRMGRDAPASGGIHVS